MCPEQSRIKVMFVITGLATGGAENMLLKMCARLDRDRFVPSVVSLWDKGVVGPKIEALQVPVHALGIHPRRPSPAGLLRLRRLVAQQQPDVLQGWMYHGNLAASLARRGKPALWGIRQSLYDLAKERWLTRWVIRLSAYTSRSASAIVYNSRVSAGQHQAMGFHAAATQIIPNGFDVDAYRPDEAARHEVRRELGLSANALLIGLIARYHPMKDHVNFLKAAAQLQLPGRDVNFVLAGRGADRDNDLLLRALHELRLDKRTFLLGEREDVARLTAALDIATSASAWGEGFANAIGEAMSCAVPCVVTDVGDSAWIVGDTGKVVPMRDAAALAGAWRDLIEPGIEVRQTLGRRARQRVVDNFSLPAVVKQYEDLYVRLGRQGVA
jgi:glycosyltransferase involved in cell wall biosynthesis